LFKSDEGQVGFVDNFIESKSLNYLDDKNFEQIIQAIQTNEIELTYDLSTYVDSALI
jgi:hypothetical protein